MQHRMDILHTSSFWKNFQLSAFLKKQNIRHSGNKSAGSTVWNTSAEATVFWKLSEHFFCKQFLKKACEEQIVNEQIENKWTKQRYFNFSQTFC